MTIFTRNALYSFILFFLVANLTTIAMEQPEPQLQNPREKDGVVHFDCTIRITEKTSCPILYAIQKYHNNNCNLPSKPHDPLVFCDVIEPQINQICFLPIPAKLLHDLSDNSKLQLYLKWGTIHFNNKSLKNKPLFITATLTKNPYLEGSSSAEQLNNALGNFFTNPSVVDPDKTEELEKAGIVNAKTKLVPTMRSTDHGPIYLAKKQKTFSHGPNGCSNKNVFIQSVINEKISTNKNRVLALRDREMNGRFKKSY